jgi:hypothetical protein
VPGLLTRMCKAIREGWHDPATHWGAVYQGIYEIKDSRVIGTVRHVHIASDRPPSSILIERYDTIIGQCSSPERLQDGWRFEIDVGAKFSAEDVLRDRIKVVALDRLGGRSLLQLIGAAQLAYVKEAFGEPAEAELIIDFSQQGNSGLYVRDGWHPAERDHTWSRGTESLIEVPVGQPGGAYRMQLLVWPFVVNEKIPSQTLAVFVGDCLLTRAFIQRGNNLVEFEILPDLIRSDRLLLRFEHPDAARPCDHVPSKDNRMLALAFKTVTLRRTVTRPVCGGCRL